MQSRVTVLTSTDYGAKLSQACHVSPLSVGPVASGLHNGLQNQFLTRGFPVFNRRGRAHSGLSVHPVTVGPPARGAGQVQRVMVERPTGRTTLIRGAWSARLCLGQWRRGERLLTSPTTADFSVSLPFILEPEVPAGGIKAAVLSAWRAAPSGLLYGLSCKVACP